MRYFTLNHDLFFKKKCIFEENSALKGLIKWSFSKSLRIFAVFVANTTML